MRILFLAHRLPYPPNKGDKLRSFWELKTLHQKHEVDLFCFYDDQEDIKYLEQVKQYCRELYAERIEPLSARFRAAAYMFSGRPFSLGFYASSKFGRRVERALAENHYDLAVAFSSSMAPYVENRSIPKVLDMVDIDSEKWGQFAEQCRAPKSWMWAAEHKRLQAYEIDAAKKFCTTLLCTEPETEHFQQLSGLQNVRFLPHRTDTQYFEPASVGLTDDVKNLQPYIVFSGQMDYTPNVDAVEYFCREIFPLVRARYPTLRYVITGRNPARSVRRLAEIPGVIVTGSVPDIRPYLKGAIAAALPLRMGRGIPNKIVEALAMGIPAITTKRTSDALPSCLSTHVMVGQSAAEFAQCIERVMAADIHRPDMRIVTSVKGYFAQDFERTFLSLIEEVAKGVAASEVRDQQEMSLERQGL